MASDSPRSRLPSAWLDFFRFVRAPQLPQPVGLRAGWRTLLAMIALDLLGLIVLIPVLAGWQKLSGVGDPEAFGAIPKQWLFAAAVIAAPILEESIFRGPLSGRPRAFWLLGCVIAFFAAFALLRPHALQAAALLGGALVVGLAGWFALRRRPTPAWFAHHFAWFYFASALVFGLVHTFNYGTPELRFLPLVLPQLWSGLTLGYTRTKVGLPASMLLHASANALAVGLTLAGV